MGVIATLIPTQTHLQRLRTAIRDRHQLVLCDDWQAVLDTCESQPVRLAIVDLFAGGRASFERVRQLKQRLPRLTMLAYVTVTSDRAHDLFDAGRQGMDGLVIAEQDDSPRALLALVEQAESRSLAAVVRQSVEDAEPTVRDAVLLCVTRAHERLSPDGLARLLALPRRTVSQRLATAGYPAAAAADHVGPAHRRRAPARGQATAAPIVSRRRSISPPAAPSATPASAISAPRRGEIRERGGAAYVMEVMQRIRNLASVILRNEPTKDRSAARRT